VNGRRPLATQARDETGGRGGILLNFGESGKIDPEEIPGRLP
jgi:hypothetical protein